MKVTLEKKEKNQVELAVEIEKETVEKAYERAYREISQHVFIPGFRRGKAPRQLIERHVGEDAVRQEAEKALANDSYNKAIVEANVEPISQPRYEVVALKKGEAATFRYMVEVRPDVELGLYLGIKVETKRREITDSEFERSLEGLLARKASFESVDRPARSGDLALIDFKGMIDGTPFEGGTATGFRVEIQPGRFIPGFVEGLVDMKAGDEKDLEIKMPEDYHAKELAGKDTVFHLVVHEVQERKLPELTDELAKELGAESVDDLKAKIREQLEGAAEEQWEIEGRKQLLEKIVEGCSMEVPESMIRREIYFLLQQHFDGLARQGIDVRQMFTEDNRAEWEKRFEDEAGKRLRTSLTLGAIARKEGIVVSDQDIAEAIAEYAAMLGRDPQQFADEVVKDGRYAALADEVLSNNIIEWLYERAEVEGRPQASGDQAEASASPPAEQVATPELPAGETK